ncbi:hypothetical protein QE152_g40787 [Popillia japonica]|uniref:Endonuclease-reverse transcriptase n=1 Tax=Popillia japonica TaxID=7064 RepID=A0AAW1HFC8_POPJA
MPEDRVLRADAMVLKTVEAVLKSEELLNSISTIIAEKLEQKIENITKAYEQKVSQLEEKLNIAYKTIDSLEQYSRRNSLRIYGLPMTTNENSDEAVIQFCKEKLQVEVKKEMIDCSHRLGKEENRSKPLLVKFVNKNIKQEIYRKKSRLKGSKIVIREDLTHKNIQLMKNVRDKFTTAWTNNCNIFTKVNGKIYKINNASDINKINIKT